MTSGKQPEEVDPLSARDAAADASTPVVDEEAVKLEAEPREQDDATVEAESAIRSSLATLGFVAFDAAGTDNTTAGLMVSAERRKRFRRDVYVGIKDDEQQIEFLGRVVEGPFHTPHEVSPDSAISRTTLLHPERTQFRPTYYVYGTIEILGEVRDGERVTPTPTRPRPYSTTYIFPSDRLQKMLGLEGSFFLGHLLGYERVEVHADGESKNLLPRNIGVFGTIGAGKSTTTQVLMEEALSAGWAVVTIDVEGEYVRMDEPNQDPRLVAALSDQFGLEAGGVSDLRVYVPSSGTSEAASPIRFKVPISAIQEEVLGDIIELSEAQQRMFGTLTAAALRAGTSTPTRGSRRMGALAGSTTSPAASRPYTLQTLIDGLDADQSWPLLGANVRGQEAGTAHVLRGKLIHLGRSGMLDWNATVSVPELPIDEMLEPRRLSVLDVSETDDRSRNIAISYILQSLFDRVLDTERGETMPNGRPRPPLLVVIEEVHTFVSRASVSKMRAVLDQLQIISRRGRKRWMGLALISQQPGHVPDELFELANTRFIHQLKSATNLAPVRQTTGGVHEALWATVPALGPGQCLLTGPTFRNPIFVTLRPAKCRRLLID